MFTIEEISLESQNRIEEIKIFLKKFNLKYESDIDYTIAVYDNGNIVATASKTKNVLKCFAIQKNYQGQGITNSLIKKIEDRMFEESLYHFFIFTYTYNKEIFTSIGYKEVITSNDITILENGNKNIISFLNNIKNKNNINDDKKACIIMNANPFTSGHKYLIEKAACENNQLIVFVVSEDKSSFPFEIRFKLIKEGIKDLKNVYVVETGPYLISNATFPTYFLKQNTDIVELQTKIDCDIFLKYYKEIFNITRRYVGCEPYCEVTSTYNKIMKDILPQNGVEVVEIMRKSIDDDIISASKVRDLLKNKDFKRIKKIVPETTYAYLISKEAEPIINKIKNNEGRH